VSDLIGRFGDHRGDATSAQLGADGSTRVGLVGTDPVRAGAWCHWRGSSFLKRRDLAGQAGASGTGGAIPVRSYSAMTSTRRWSRGASANASRTVCIRPPIPISNALLC
jgi:hypothetical protein